MFPQNRIASDRLGIHCRNRPSQINAGIELLNSGVSYVGAKWANTQQCNWLFLGSIERQTVVLSSGTLGTWGWVGRGRRAYPRARYSQKVTSPSSPPPPRRAAPQSDFLAVSWRLQVPHSDSCTFCPQTAKRRWPPEKVTLLKGWELQDPLFRLAKTAAYERDRFPGQGITRIRMFLPSDYKILTQSRL